MGNVPHGLMCLNTRSPVDGAVWEYYGALRRYSLAGGNRPMGADIEVL